jgi:hypothetical protein
MNTPYSPQQLDRMAWTISSRGFDDIPAAALRELGFEARRAGVSPSVAYTMTDSDAPLVARQRAFGFVAAKLASWNGFNTPAAKPAPAIKVTCAA